MTIIWPSSEVLPDGWERDGTGTQRIDHSPTTCDSSANAAYDQGYRAALTDAAARLRVAAVMWCDEPDSNPAKALRLPQYREACRVLAAWAVRPQVVRLNTRRGKARP